MIKIEVEINRETLEGILESASRGARYWCDNCDELGFESTIERVLDGGGIKLYDQNDDDTIYDLDRDILKIGLQKMAQKEPEQFGRLLSGSYDGGTGDILLQCALLGDVIYG